MPRLALASLVVLACSHPPAPAERSAVVDGPTCGTPTYRAMSDALDARCSHAVDEDAVSCAIVREGFAACRGLLWRDPAVIAPRVAPGTMAIYARPGAGAWAGAVFRRDGGAWIVGGFATGEIH